MHELLTSGEMRAADARTIAAGTPGRVLMERAGRAVADAVSARHPVGTRVLILCGPGNNGGDGFVAARLLVTRGYRVEVALLGEREALKGDAALAAADWKGPVAAAAAARPDEARIIVDALFGAGLARELDGAARTLVEAVNGSGAHVVAVDIPSGIDGDSGAIRGTGVRAHETVTFARRKPGHLLLPGRLHCGHVRVADIGISDDVIAGLAIGTRANHPAWWRPQFPVPALDAHKYRRGHAVVISGGIAGTGAARLAARGALRAGAGLVTVASPPAALAVNAAQLTAVMVRPVDGADGLAAFLEDSRINALVIGPAAGVGPATRRMVETAAGRQRALVLDADALSSFAGDAEGLRGIAGAMGRSGVILTPHEGEFARIFKDQSDVVNAPSKLERARAAAAATGAVIVLKGPDTVIAAPDGRAAINENGTPWLATAGAGDVLAGIAAGLLAQAMPPFLAACAAVWLHAAAGERVGPGLIAEDLPEALPAVLRDLLAGIDE
ncbi:NAD(P)H-hydrate dehydratase [Chelatococcus sp. SYSU_G07232]|uniref:Bifunctional NAD(P)H-hydrate repair enzyme n=1 Tax=Chelatococcus albus TaxID=3047466 RepID=A0ABT7ABI6_9HYPH|nr:NAD(P)H-hydrate dehydratase [Chelatococcus sp. SYSU_G07232]MDJ1156735.1 NAD(P)H-hydrate dehydratase [Chelatococcus sp. SYSU_G07232]